MTICFQLVPKLMSLAAITPLSWHAAEGFAYFLIIKKSCWNLLRNYK